MMCCGIQDNNGLIEPNFLIEVGAMWSTEVRLYDRFISMFANSNLVN